MRQALGFASEARESPDTQALLPCAEKEEDLEEARDQAPSHRLEKRWAPQSVHLEGAQVGLGFPIPLDLAAWSL